MAKSLPMATMLVRRAVSKEFDEAKCAHTGLLLDRGFPELNNEDSQTKTKHIADACKIAANEYFEDFYSRAYHRWQRAISDPKRFMSAILELESRMFIGLAGGAMETGCAISRSYGAPYIPGSSIKGVASHHARNRFSEANSAEGSKICDELFGAATDGETEPEQPGKSGLMVLHDAWWVPCSAPSPLIQEVVTTHHPDYYNDGSKAAKDTDKPIPNAQIAVRGAFLFVIEGPPIWFDFVKEILIDALTVRGAGAKTSAGYGRFSATSIKVSGPICRWVDETIAKLSKEFKSEEDSTLRTKKLAEAWNSIADPKLKDEAFADIRKRWEDRGWWKNTPSGRSTKSAKEIYGAYQGPSSIASRFE